MSINGRTIDYEYLFELSETGSKLPDLNNYYYFIDTDGDVCFVDKEFIVKNSIEKVSDFINFPMVYDGLIPNRFDGERRTLHQFKDTNVNVEDYIVDKKLYNYSEIDELIEQYNNFFIMENI